MGNPPRKVVKRYIPSFVKKGAPVSYHALYHMNVASESKRKRFIGEVSAAMAVF
jgi:hypothetical protein